MGNKAHNERCGDCKDSVENLLVALFGVVQVDFDLDLPCRLEDYANTSIYDSLAVVHEALQKYRGFNEFVKARKLSRVDFYIPNLQLIVEFDESQHFTKPRDISLSFYSDKHELGFSVQRWRSLCQELDKRDNDPPYRDEQRAWYDTLRDFAPVLIDAGKTIRLFSRDHEWCSLKPDCKADLRTFERAVLLRKAANNDKNWRRNST